jgi:hypothetical protein
MQVGADTLSSLLDRDTFVSAYCQYVTDVLRDGARLFPQFAIPRLHDAHRAWTEDLHRVGHMEPSLDQGLDHFKQCGHLAFWLRRTSPLIDVVDTTKNIADAPGYPLTDSEMQFRELLFAYANEYLAFDLGYQICNYHERAKPGGSARAVNLIPSVEYYTTTCHFLKWKTVSPHAVYLIYKSLFVE